MIQSKTILSSFLLVAVVAVVVLGAMALAPQDAMAQATVPTPDISSGPDKLRTQENLEGLLQNVAELLVRIGAIIAVIGLAVSAILYFVAGSGDTADTAKSWVKNVVIGAVILFGIGIILQFAEGIGTLNFFG